MIKEEVFILRIVRIRVFHWGDEDKDILFDRIIQAVERRYEIVKGKGQVLDVFVNDILCHVEMEEINDFFVLTSIIKCNDRYKRENMSKYKFSFFDLSSSLSHIPSLNILSTFAIFIFPAEDENLAIALVEKLSHYLSKPRIGVGNC